MSDGSVHADRTDEKDDDDNPERERAEALLPGASRMRYGCRVLADGTAFKDIAPTQRQTKQHGKTTERKIGCPPTRATDDRLRNDRKDHGAQACSDHHESERRSQAPLKPSRNGARIGEMSRAIAHQAEHDAG